MENVKSLFTRNVWTKLATNERLMQNGKPAKYVVAVPNFEVKKNGEVLDAGDVILIKTSKEAYAYENRYKDVVDILKQRYPDISVVRRIFTASLKEAISELSGNWADTTSGKILRGQSMSNARVFQNMYGTDPVNTVAGFLNTLKTYEGKEVVLPKVKKTKLSVMKQFSKNPVGYYIPEITAKGLVVRPLVGSGNTAFDVNCSAFNSKDVSREQVVEYLKAPFGDAKVNVDFDRVVELSQMAYSSIGTDEFLPKVKFLVDYITANYPLSFEKIKKDKVSEVKQVLPQEKTENTELKKKVDELFKTPLMLQEANAQTLVDETRTRMKTNDSTMLKEEEERLKLIQLIHNNIEKKKAEDLSQKSFENMPENPEVVEFEEPIDAKGMPELDIDEIRAGLETEKEDLNKSEEPIISDFVVSEDKGSTHFTFIINNCTINQTINQIVEQQENEDDEVLEELMFRRKESKVKGLNGEPVKESAVDIIKERE